MPPWFLPSHAVIPIGKPREPSANQSLPLSMPASTLGHPDRLINYDAKIKKWRTANTVFTSWLFLGLGKCILPTTFVLTESFSASMPPRGQHPTVIGNRESPVWAPLSFPVWAPLSSLIVDDWCRLSALGNLSAAKLTFFLRFRRYIFP
jgi:hypothetical protein